MRSFDAQCLLTEQQWCQSKTSNVFFNALESLDIIEWLRRYNWRIWRTQLHLAQFCSAVTFDLLAPAVAESRALALRNVLTSAWQEGMSKSMTQRQLEDSIVRGLLRAAPDGILACDADGLIILANEQLEQMLGYQPGELLGQKIEALVPAASRSGHEALRQGYFQLPRRRPMGIGLDLSATRKDGSTLPVEISLSTFASNGETCAVAVVRDVTELRQMSRELKLNNRQLKRSNAELEQFAYVASHDLQEPLRTIAGYTQLLQRRFAHKLDKEATEYIDFAVGGVKRMQALICDLLTYSRVSSRSDAFVPVDLNEVMKQVLSNLEYAIDEAQALVQVNPLPELPGDPVQLTQLLQNLLSNALKFRYEGRPVEVRIAAQRDGVFWRITVQDNGIGIAAEHSEKIFVIFQRINGQERYSGTGIGLAICKRVVERHGGVIWVESTPGLGTSCHFTLLAAADP